MLGDASDRKAIGRYFAISQVGLEMVLPIIGGVALDYYWSWPPWGVVLGAVLGLCGGVVHLLYLTQADRDDKKPMDSPNDAQGPGPGTP